MREPGQILIVSCYELGHQPLAAASTLAFLERAGFHPRAIDLSVDGIESLRGMLDRVELVGISVPMHTALHIGVRAARRIREAAPAAHLCFCGHYAVLNAKHLLDGPADSVIGGEFEGPLVELAQSLESGRSVERLPATALLKRLSFPLPSRQALPPLERYAQLEVQGTTRQAAAVEASRGCRFHCRHCPIPPVYGGRFFVVPREIVLEDIGQLVEQGATHITFADADFFNGPGHSLAIARALHERHAQLTFDLTTKVELILKHRERFAELADLGCLFVVSAVESLSDLVLRHLAKGHTREDVFEALGILRAAGISLRPSLVAFTPWTTHQDYLDVLEWVDGEALVDQVDPVQLSIRLLVPPGSLLAEDEAMRPHLGPLEPQNFSYPWRHPDPRMDRLHQEVNVIVQRAAMAREDSRQTFERIRIAAWEAAGQVAPARSGQALPARQRVRAPRLTEPWFC